MTIPETWLILQGNNGDEKGGECFVGGRKASGVGTGEPGAKEVSLTQLTNSSRTQMRGENLGWVPG